MPLSASISIDELNDIGDVDTAGVAANDLLFFDGSDWVDTASLVQWDTAAFTVTGQIRVTNGDGGILVNEAASLTNPTIRPIRTDANSGLTGDAGSADTVGLIAGGVLGVIYREVTDNILVENSMRSAITASVVQAQGNGALDSSYNEVMTTANANDVVTLPGAAQGRPCLIINNGANTLQIFPASGDDLGAGVDTSVTLATTLSKLFFAWDATNWNQVT